MAGIYVYRDRWARIKDLLGSFAIFFGLGFIPTSLLLHFEDGVAHLPLWAGPLLALWGFCMNREAKARAYSERSKLSAKFFGIIMIIVQVLALVEVVIHRNFGLKDLLFSLVPAPFAAAFLHRGCKRKSWTVSVMLVGYAAAILLANINSLLPESSSSNRIFLLNVVLILLSALKLTLRRIKYLLEEEEAEYI